MSVEAAVPQLRGQPALRGLVAAELTSMTGTQLSAVAIPWFVLEATGSAGDMGLVMGAQWVGIAVLGVVGSNWAGRFGPRRTMLAADLLCASLLALVPLLHRYDCLPLPLVMAVMFVVGGCTAPYLTSQQLILDSFGRDEALLSRANAALQAATRLAMLVGPAAAGVLVSAVRAPGVLLLDSASFALSAVIVWRCLPADAAERPGRRRPALAEGVRALFRDRLLGAWSLGLALAETAWQALFALLPLLALARHHDAPSVAGVLLAAFGGGAILGTLLLHPALRVTSAQRLAVAGRVALGLAFAVLLAPLTLGQLIGCLAVVGLLNGLSAAPIVSVRLTRVPAATRSETLTVATAAALSGGALGWVLAGATAQAAGVTTALAATVAVQTAATLLFVFGAYPARAVTASEG
ncbi:putative multidrug-efflux transporter [Streptomyces sp. YIM 121038]|uniref:MFS transporter n=1 Tax=Streptomyces sp. YIM 121038 TaxID=2136401 RepID=UPI0011645CD9|nr:MFS transporter [Streptomyces sp. YIM 121038]QCX80847.1 putative multidrug-efflux transporter [Streptomyces sp. YIM 121038]